MNKQHGLTDIQCFEVGSQPPPQQHQFETKTWREENQNSFFQI
jgi:hypothetical protein